MRWPWHGERHRWRRRRQAPTFTNPIREGADPWISVVNGLFHLVDASVTESEGYGIHLAVAPTLAGLGSAPRQALLRAADLGAGGEHLWAPELHMLDGHWYLYYAAAAEGLGRHRMYVARSQTALPEGPYGAPQVLALPGDTWAIDGTVLDLTGRRFFAWSGWAGADVTTQHLYLARLDNPHMVTGPAMLLSSPTLPWERHGGGVPGYAYVNEGPAVLVANGWVYLSYSASGSWTPEYCLGLLTADADGDLMDPRVWRKSPEPVFWGRAGAYGPGHNSFFASPDGSETWFTYHANTEERSGFSGRTVRAQPLRWRRDGTPHFGRPVRPGQRLREPAGAHG